MNLYKSIFAALTVFVSAMTLAAMDDYHFQFPTPEIKERYEQLTYELRCPKCQNQNVADSNAEISIDIRTRVHDLLLEGKTDQEIIDHMIDRYTEFVVYRPQMSLATVWLYIVPVIVLLIGVLAIFFKSRKGSLPSDKAISAEEQEKINELLKQK